MNYLSVEPRTGVDPETVESRLARGETFDEWSERDDDTVVVAGYGGDREPAVEALEALEADVERAFLLHLYDTTMTGVGWVYERTPDGLTEREEVPGGERYGVDVVDYVKREYDIDGPR